MKNEMCCFSQRYPNSTELSFKMSFFQEIQDIKFSYIRCYLLLISNDNNNFQIFQLGSLTSKTNKSDKKPFF